MKKATHPGGPASHDASVEDPHEWMKGTAMTITESRNGKRLRGKALTAAAVAGGLVLAGGVAYAAIPASDGTITSCYTTANVLLGSPKGSLRVVDDAAQCRKTEQALTWNQTGPKGDPGSEGPQGEKGDPGAPGTSTALTAAGFANNVANNGTGRVLSKSVPAGAYVVSGSVTLSASGNSASEIPTVACRLIGGGRVLASADASVASIYTGQFQGYISLPLTGTFTPSATSTVALECSQLGTDNVNFTGDLTMIKVDSIAD